MKRYFWAMSKPCQDWFLYPNLIHSTIKKKENIASQNGAHKKIVTRTGTCLQLFANWRPPAHCKLSRLIWQQFFYFVNNRVKVSNFSKENQQIALVVCDCLLFNFEIISKFSDVLWAVQPMTMKHVNNQSNFAILLGTWYSVPLWWLLDLVPKHVFERNFFKIKFELIFELTSL
jgi:hypothetical protein